MDDKQRNLHAHINKMLQNELINNNKTLSGISESVWKKKVAEEEEAKIRARSLARLHEKNYQNRESELIEVIQKLRNEQADLQRQITTLEKQVEESKRPSCFDSIVAFREELIRALPENMVSTAISLADDMLVDYARKIYDDCGTKVQKAVQQAVSSHFRKQALSGMIRTRPSISRQGDNQARQRLTRQDYRSSADHKILNNLPITDNY